MRKTIQIDNNAQLKVQIEIGCRLFDLRQKLNKSQARVADETKISQPVLCRLEKGDRLIDLFTLTKLSYYYRVEIIDLIPIDLKDRLRKEKDKEKKREEFKKLQENFLQKSKNS
jgi:transcriptional regulator with XRE-family HTH domain